MQLLLGLFFGGMMRSHTSSRRAAFTLVELLVVIGIIAVLISLLLPALNKARQSSQTTQCLSNLRQIGMSLTQYSDENRGYLVPANTAAGGDWVTILVEMGDIPLQLNQQFGTVTASKQSNNCLWCPSGSDAECSGSPAPPTKQSPLGAGWYDHFDPTNGLNLHYCAWYSLNGAISTANVLGIYPFNYVPGLLSAGGASTMVTVKMTALQPSSMIPFAFDGPLLAHGGSDTRINCRHNNFTLCNIVFADGHCESLRADQLPGGANGTSASSELANSNTSLAADAANIAALDARNSSVHWMLAQ